MSASPPRARARVAQRQQPRARSYTCGCLRTYVRRRAARRFVCSSPHPAPQLRWLRCGVVRRGAGSHSSARWAAPLSPAPRLWSRRRCGVCRAIMDEVAYGIAQVDPKKTIQTGAGGPCPRPRPRSRACPWPYMLPDAACARPLGAAVPPRHRRGLRAPASALAVLLGLMVDVPSLNCTRVHRAWWNDLGGYTASQIRLIIGWAAPRRRTQGYAPLRPVSPHAATALILPG